MEPSSPILSILLLVGMFVGPLGLVLLIGSVIGRNWWLWAGGGALLLWGALAWAFNVGFFVHADPQLGLPPEEEVAALFRGAVAWPAAAAVIAAGLIIARQWRGR